MPLSRTLRYTTRRNLISSLFGLVFTATVVTVSASNLLPCPARPRRGRYADADEAIDARGMAEASRQSIVVVAKRPKRWIEETDPTKR
jgi:cytochrome c oxidase assembly factor 2